MIPIFQGIKLRPVNTDRVNGWAERHLPGEDELSAV
jgi:hypothetical protein